MKLSSVLEQLLKRHKLIGVPLKPYDIPEETKESLYSVLKTDLFFEHIEEYEYKGVSLCYDELIEYTVNKHSDRFKTAHEEIKYMGTYLKSTFRDILHSFYISKYQDKYYLHIKYTREPSTLLIGPEVPREKTPESTAEIEEFKKIWADAVEYRKFPDGKVKVCVSFKPSANDTMRYEMLSKIFRIVTEPETKYSKKDAKKRIARILTPTIPHTTVETGYTELNKKQSNDLINKALESIRDSFPVTLLEAVYTGSYNRKTRAVQNVSQIYLKVGRGHIWPTDNPRLSNATVTALNGVLGKSLEKYEKVQGISPDNTLQSTIFGETFEFIFDVEGEQKMHLEKYYLMNFRVEYERFFQEISSKQKVFPKLCALIKNLLHAHGLYPNHISDKPIEILCYRTGYTANTLAGGLRAVVSTKYTHGYTLDIRRGKCKIRSKHQATGTIEVTHRAGMYTIELPGEDIFNEINRIFKRTLQILESIPGITSSREVSSIFKEVFIPSTEKIAFSLSRVQLQGYEEISHYNKDLGGSSCGSDEKHCYSVLVGIECIPYFCRSGVLHVQVKNLEILKLAVGVSVLLTGMKYIKVRESVPI